MDRRGFMAIQVKDIDLMFPGYQGPEAGGMSPASYNGTAEAMTTDEVRTYCAPVGAGGTASAARAARTAQAVRAQRQRLRERFKITVCRTKRRGARSSQRRWPRCTRRTVTGARPPRLRRVTATLERAGRTYAVENNRRGGVRFKQRRHITPGRYRMILRKKPRKMVVRHNGRRLHRAEQHMTTIVPVTIRWTRRK